MTCLDQRPEFDINSMPEVLKKMRRYFSMSSDSKDFKFIIN